MRRRLWRISLATTLLVAAPRASQAKRYSPTEKVPVIANKVGPFNNPTETYQYFSLPFCREDGDLQPQKQRLRETLAGDRKVEATLYDVNFGVDVVWGRVCKRTLQPAELHAFVDAIEDKFYFEMYVDDLPVWGYVGEVQGEDLRFSALRKYEDPRVSLYPHLSFTIGYNDDQIVAVNVTTDHFKRIDITDISVPKEVEFTYSVQWVADSLAHDDRMSRYVDSRFLPSSFEIHWLSIINSFVLVLLLTAFLTIIMMRVLKNDFSRYMEVDEDDLGEEETGWKLIHGDVFRFPRAVNFFAALVGSGAQMCTATMLLLLCALAGVFRPTKRGSILTCVIVLYVLTSFVGGFLSARLYRQLGGKHWVRNVVTTALVFPGPLFCIFSCVNSIAWYCGSTAALPVFTAAVVFLMWLLIAFPLTVLGAITGRNLTGDMQVPCRTTKVPREVPQDVPWYRQSGAQMFMSGFLPFSAIYIELHYIFASIWGHKIYTLFGILILAFVLLLIVCRQDFITVALIYFQLAREDHRWWWRSFLSGGSTGLFIYAYSFFYFFNRSSMEGFLQGAFYFGYMAVISYAFFVMLGCVGFYSSLFFVRHIYSVVKCD
ncbi:unnamed protein product [Phaeothamnion confervicola]